MSNATLRIGYIPLVDAAALIVAVDMGFVTAERLDIELVREVSWSNVRDKLNIGLFDAAHLLSPVAIASSLGIGESYSATAPPTTSESTPKSATAAKKPTKASKPQATSCTALTAFTEK